MCGLIAAFYPDSVEPPTPEAVKSRLHDSLETIKYRGPDSSGIYVSPDARVGLGHVRLSIIDLPTGQQPLSDEEELIHCVVTGEIYDHERIRAEMQSQGYSFKCMSDSELVVQLYKRDGFNFLMHLRGEFAFVLYDLKRRLVLAARDRFGIKPLYYTVHNGCIMFASEMKAFMALGWQAEWDIESIVENGEFADERTVFRGVHKLPAGYFAVCRPSGQIQTQAYWDLKYPAASSPMAPPATLDEIALRIRELLVEAVRLRLRSDVPLAMYLSGGIDSSCVAGIATQLLRETDPDAKLTAFTLAFVEDPTTDESPLAERTARHIGADLRKIDATEARLVGMLEESIWHSEQANMTFHGAGRLLLSRAVRDAGFKVVLSGEGSDEVFAGYPWFPPDYLQSADAAGAALGIALPSEAERRALAEEYHAATGMPLRTRSAMSPHISNAPRPLITTGSHLAWLFQVSDAVLHPKVVERTGVPNQARYTEEGLDARVRENSVTGHWHPLNVSLYTTAKTLLGQRILNLAGDRADMAHSVESRVAFLDHHVVDYVSTLPPSLKLRPIAGASPGKWHLVEKWILRQAVKPFVTEEVYLRKKVAFNPPPRPRPSGAPPASASVASHCQMQQLLPLQTHLKARITQASVQRLGFFNWPYIEGQLSEYLASPEFLPNGRLDPRASMLMNVLSHIVLQERFHVPSYEV
ncbi:putative asparagine synthase [Mycena pura]|uniref:Asparagine synthase n=1 Tax=Mycena pura TaxID=153505 RepID=A0AAD6VNJ0_9AGAR|nr:putative asparagine synthase [Mycena pura]